METVSMRTIAHRARTAHTVVACGVALCVVAVGLASGCGSSAPRVAEADRAIEQDLRRGVRAVRETRDRRALRAELRRLVGHLRRVHGTTPSARRARELALRGFEATLEGIKSQIEFRENDSGQVAEATKDAKRADLYLRRGADRLRAAGQALGIRVGELDGY
jgi:hypothetical protein